MENFDPNFICNHSDKARGRYRFNSQPEICQWNLLRLCEALAPLINLEYSSLYVAENYRKLYYQFYYDKMAQRLGIVQTRPPTKEELSKEGVTRKTLISEQEIRELSKDEK